MNRDEAPHSLSKILLNEYEAKKYLAQFGIPVVAETMAKDPDQACLEADRLGFPVVLKAVGRKLPHKTEAGGVVLNLSNRPSVLDAGVRLMQIPGCEGLLVQKMVRGQRELVGGLTRDPHFGPCVMLGLGGVLTEALENAVFRLAPLTEWDAQQMILDLGLPKLMGAFRGEAAVDENALSQVLVALGEIGERQKEVIEIDLNPIKIQPDGTPIAVDALVVLTAA